MNDNDDNDDDDDDDDDDKLATWLMTIPWQAVSVKPSTISSSQISHDVIVSVST